jgi:hypothetical protein
LLSKKAGPIVDCISWLVEMLFFFALAIVIELITEGNMPSFVSGSVISDVCRWYTHKWHTIYRKILPNKMHSSNASIGPAISTTLQNTYLLLLLKYMVQTKM